VSPENRIIIGLPDALNACSTKPDAATATAAVAAVGGTCVSDDQTAGQPSAVRQAALERLAGAYKAAYRRPVKETETHSSDLDLLASLKAQDKEARHRTITAMTPRTCTRLEELAGADFDDFDELRSELCGVPPQVAEARAAAMAEHGGAGELDGMGVGEPDIYDFDYMQSQSDYMSTPRF
jgi:hypothetical protein